MLTLAVGYQPAEPGEESFFDLIAPYGDAVSELFFAWPGHASGRSPVGLGPDGRIDGAAFARFEADLIRFRRAGKRLDVLFNANCYGGDAMSVELEAEVIRILRYAADHVGGVDVVTTTSPAIAWMVKRQFPEVDVRASVNMRIGSVAGMDYLADRFDSYHIQRDVQRNLAHVELLKNWAASRGKKLVMLANSGCLRDCSGQTFHDNLVAHESDVSQSTNIKDFMPYACWAYLKDPARWAAVLQATWVRPEDVDAYAGRVDLIKLATRMHDRPHVVVGAYARRAYAGNLLDLLEPGFSRLLAPKVIDNRRFPPDWLDTVSTCDGRCHRCGYCSTVLDQVLVDLGVTVNG